MRIAIPEWQGRVSPVFDVAVNMLLIDVDGGHEVGREQRRLHGADVLFARIAEFLSFGAGTLICGAISAPVEARLVASGVQVVGFTCGMVGDVLTAYLTGELTNQRFAMPGCKRRWRDAGDAMFLANAPHGEVPAVRHEAEGRRGKSSLMKIAVASGKGGTGKTTIATNLAWAAARSGRSVAYIDCDVEEPNGHLFLKPHITSVRSIGRLHPQVDETKCRNCGVCGRICQYSAIVCIGSKVLVYPELCHACGGCSLVCRLGAIKQVLHGTGILEEGMADTIHFLHGVLNVGEAMSAPMIRQVKATRIEADLQIIDSPPGTSCPVIESVRGADLVLLVTEPTPFGLNDLELAVEMVKALRLPLAVVINRAGVGDQQTQEYCRHNGIEILSEVTDDRRVAEAYSRGDLAYEAVPEFHLSMDALLARLCATNSAMFQTATPEVVR